MDLLQFVITRQGQGQEKKDRPTCMRCQIGFPISYIIIQSVNRSLWHVSCVCGWRTRFENEGIGMYQIRVFKHQLQTPMDCVLLNEIHQSRRKRTIRLLVSRPVWLQLSVGSCLLALAKDRPSTAVTAATIGWVLFFLSVGDSNYYLICRNLIFSTNTRGSTEVGI